MSNSVDTQKDFKLGDFVIKPSQCLVGDKNGDTPLEPKSMRLLLELAKNSGKIVSRDDLFSAIWGEQAVTDYALNTLIANLRKSLGDQADSPKYIETRPKLGYQLIAKISPVEGESIASVLPEENNDSTSKTEAPSSTQNSEMQNKHWKIVLLVLLLVSTFLLFINYYDSRVLDGEEDASEQPSVTSKASNNELNNTTQISKATIQHRYLTRINIMIESSTNNEAGNPICISAEADVVVKLEFANNDWSLKYHTWTLYSEFYDIELKHKAEDLTNLVETHYIEHRHPYGIVKEKMTVTFDESQDFTGASTWNVHGVDDKILCTGRTLFIAQKL